MWISLNFFAMRDEFLLSLPADRLATLIYLYDFKLVASHQDCCQPKCELFNCTAPYAPSAAKKDVVGDPGKHRFLATTQRSQRCYALLVESKRRSSTRICVLNCLDLSRNMSWSWHVYSLYTRTHIGRMIEAASLFKVSSKAEDCDVDACIVRQLFSSLSHLEMCSFSTWISLWKTMMKCRVITACGKRIHHLNLSYFIILACTIAYLIVLAVFQPGLLWDYLSASHFCILFVQFVHVRIPHPNPSPYPCQQRCRLQLLHSWLGTQRDQEYRDWPERRGPKRVRQELNAWGQGQNRIQGNLGSCHQLDH